MATKYTITMNITGWYYTRVYVEKGTGDYVGHFMPISSETPTITAESTSEDSNTLEIINNGINATVTLLSLSRLSSILLQYLNSVSKNITFVNSYVIGGSSDLSLRPKLGGNKYISDVRYGIYGTPSGKISAFYPGGLDGQSAGDNVSIPNITGTYTATTGSSGTSGDVLIPASPIPTGTFSISTNRDIYIIFAPETSDAGRNTNFIRLDFTSNSDGTFTISSYHALSNISYYTVDVEGIGSVNTFNAWFGDPITTIPVDPVEPSTDNDTRLPSQQSGGDSGSGDNSTDSGANDDDTPSQTTPEPGPDEEEPDPTPFPDPPPNIGGKGSGKVEGESIGTEALGTPDEFLGTGLNLYEFPYTYSLQNFLKILWSDTQSFKDMLANTFQNNLANCVLRIYAAKFTPEHASDTAVNIKLGSYETDVAAYKMKQYSSGSLGTFTLSEYYGSFLDYETKLEIFLPFVGFRELMPDKYISQYKTNNAFSINIWYQIDWLAGQIAYILYTGSINDNGYMNENTTPADIFTGNIAAEIPIASSQISNLLGSFVSGLGSAAGAAVSANNLLAGSGNTAAALAGVGLGLAGAATSALGFQKQTYTVQGSYGGNVGMLMPQEPYLIIYRPIQYKGYQKAHYLGYNMKLTLTAIGQLPANNFFKFDSVYLKGNIPADIKEDILQQLKQGVYI